MNTNCTQSLRLSHVTKTYLVRYYEILDEMICAMDQAQLNDSISHNFIVQMIPHHRAAIEMAESLLQTTTNVPLQEIASAIITEQTRSIANMEKAMPCCHEHGNSAEDLYLYHHCYAQITKAMFCEMRTAAVGNDINANFIREMIPHHLGAVRMAKNALAFDLCPQLTPILNAIILSQEKGICQMEALLRCL